MGETVVHPLLHDVTQKGMRAQGSSHEVADSGVQGSRLGGEGGDVAVPVVTRPQEEGGDHHRRGAGSYACAEGGTDGRFGELHVGGFDDREAPPVAPLLHERFVPEVGLVPARTVIDDHHPDDAGTGAHLFGAGVMRVGGHPPRLGRAGPNAGPSSVAG